MIKQQPQHRDARM